MLGVALTVAALGLASVPAAAWAQDSLGKPAKSETSKGPGEVTFDVVERPLKDVIAYIQEKTDVNLVIAKEAEEIPVTVKLRNLPWREALDIVVERAGAQVDEKSGNLIRIEKPPRTMRWPCDTPTGCRCASAHRCLPPMRTSLTRPVMSQPA